jgi:predicted DCC family thiol-disulfide oxidoreductase YuxK
VTAHAEAPSRSNTSSPVLVLFDGVCSLCGGIVSFVIKRDPDARFRFAPLQSAPARQLIEKHALRSDGLDSVVVIVSGRGYTHSDAVLEIARHLPGAWPVLYALRIVPRPVRDFVYRRVANHRYAVFGKQTECLVPTPDIRQRFL